MSAERTFANLERADPEIYRAIRGEIDRQRTTIELIASENFVSRAVLEAMGSPLTNKYAEGYPGKRYYGGCRFVDVAEDLARTRVKTLFGAEHANVQPHSGSTANLTCYFSFLEPGDTILGMSLAHGGHLTHGHPVNFSGRFFKVMQYGVSRETGRIDYDEVERMAREHRPKMLLAGASAYPRQFDFPRLAAIARDAGSVFVVDMAHFAGLVAAGEHPSPVPHADAVTSTTHKTLRGPRGGFILSKEAHAKAIDKVNFPGMQGGPLMHVIAAKAVCFLEAGEPAFREYAKQVVKNAKALAATLAVRGLDLVSGGTDNHLLLVDLSKRGLTGKDAEAWLEEVGITVNKNAVPFDKEPPIRTSGIRIGTPAVTSRGMKEDEMRSIASGIADVLEHPGDEGVKEKTRERVAALAAAHPLYPDL